MARFSKTLINLLVAVGVILAAPLLDTKSAATSRAAMTQAAPGDSGLATNGGPELARQRAKHKQDRRHGRGGQQTDRKHGRARDSQAHNRNKNKGKNRKPSPATTRDGLCAGPEITLSGDVDACTHGPDPAPPGMKVHKDVAPLPGGAAAAQAAGIECTGDGQNGFRVQLLYIRPSDTPSRLAIFLPSIRGWAGEEDEIVQLSAAETGGARQIRFVQDPETCQPAVVEAVVSPAAGENFWKMIEEFQSQGFNRTDRIYQAFVDANTYCGIGVVWNDDRADGNVNRHNIGPSYSRIDSGCWSGAIAAHELMHNLGSVQLSAPNTSGGFHCIDEYDVMCYQDGARGSQLKYDCQDPAADWLLLDCNHDDYFNTDPAPGSYLATHWNVANNRFLIGAPQQTTAAPSPTASGLQPAVGGPKKSTHKQKTTGKRGKGKNAKGKASHRVRSTNRTRSH